MAKILFSKAEIDALVQEQKPVPLGWQHNFIRLKFQRGHQAQDFEITGRRGNKFRIILRQNTHNKLDFSIILAVLPPRIRQPFRLRRYNGKSHEHKNHIKGKAFYDFHIHVATEHYQKSGRREDTYAEPTDRYDDYQGALKCFIEDGNFEFPPDDQLSLFREV